jgi:hypothetical protein
MRYVHLYNTQLPQSVLRSRTPMQAMKDWHKSHPHLFIKSPRNHTGRDNYHKILRVHGFKASMSGKGNCYDCEYGIAA